MKNVLTAVAVSVLCQGCLTFSVPKVGVLEGWSFKLLAIEHHQHVYQAAREKKSDESKCVDPGSGVPGGDGDSGAGPNPFLGRGSGARGGK